MADTTLKVGNKLLATINPTKPDGTPGKVDGAPVWSNVDGLVTLVPAADGLSCSVQAPTGTAGEVATVTVTADADLGAGVVEISASFTVEKTDVQVTALGFTFGAEEPI